MQQQALLTKIVKKESAIENRSVLEQEEMFRACQIGAEGLENIMEEVNTQFPKLKENVTLKNYKKLIAPLGNYILGYKTIKQFCPKYIKPTEMESLQRTYVDAKKRLHDIDDSVNKQIENKYSTTIQREYGIEPTIKSSQKETIYNVDNIYPLKDIEDFPIIDIINAYEKKTGKNAIWLGAKTQPFLRYLKKHKSPIIEKEEIVIGEYEDDEDNDEDEKEEIRIREI